MKILVVGATGFVGRSLVSQLRQCAEHEVFAGVRCEADALLPHARAVGDLAGQSIHHDAFKDIDVVIHLAARVHVKEKATSGSLKAFRQVNVEGTSKILKACAEAKVKRFIYVSTIKVNGEFTTSKEGFSEEDEPNPQDCYAKSKHEAEELIKSFCKDNFMEWIIVRPPLVYGVGVKANFHKLVYFLMKGVPLPLGGLSNRRSLISVENLNNIIISLIAVPRAANQLFLVSDGDALSVSEILHLLKRSLNSNSIIITIPRFILQALLFILGRRMIAQKLCSELVIDNTKLHDYLALSLKATRQEIISMSGSWLERM